MAHLAASIQKGADKVTGIEGKVTSFVRNSKSPHFSQAPDCIALDGSVYRSDSLRGPVSWSTAANRMVLTVKCRNTDFAGSKTSAAPLYGRPNITCSCGPSPSRRKVLFS